MSRSGDSHQNTITQSPPPLSATSFASCSIGPTLEVGGTKMYEKSQQISKEAKSLEEGGGAELSRWLHSEQSWKGVAEKGVVMSYL